jgi:hypothetical protein
VRRVWRDYSLSLVLAALFLVSWGLQTWTGWVEFVAEQQAHGQAAAVFGADGYVWSWGQATFENWQSEFLQLLTFVTLTSFLVHKGSHESKTDGEEQEARLKAFIDERLTHVGPLIDAKLLQHREWLADRDRRIAEDWTQRLAAARRSAAPAPVDPTRPGG